MALPSSAPFSSPVVLIVDDDESLRFMLTTLFRRVGYQVELASDGIEALDRLKSLAAPPDAIVSDMAMPGMDGAAFLRVLEHSPHRLDQRLVFFTANEQRVPPGAVVVAKGERLSRLLDVVGEVVRRSRRG